MYSTISVLFLRSLIIDRHIEIVEIDYLLRRPAAAIERELTIQKRVVSLFAMKKKLERLPTDFRFILKWSQSFSHYNNLIYKNGQQPFLDNNCTFRNCYLTNDKGLITDVTFFDAILFDVENRWDPHPIERSQYQRFVFVGAESAANFPICAKIYNDYYNLTWTYKLDSDISNAYLNILDKNGTIVGPKVDMTWIKPMAATPDEVTVKIAKKTKAAAWFVSNCNAKNDRRVIANHIREALMAYGLDIDIYGWCGKMVCPKNQFSECLQLLQEDYYFYLSFENSDAEDYVTEKLLHAVMNYAVPIVYGGANYSRFLPPGSYINAKEQDAISIAFAINEAMKNPKVYEKYFRWHNYYSYAKAGEKAEVCKLCEVLNSPPTFTAKKDFKDWWNTKGTCKTTI
ncbi:unnamed protein product [Chilo suppressalis]|uniref:Fucosyltransferase n=1 Tax=Chilo suppressalis TaxID=168631 RepID=A0ABN8ARW4_CHISP|nr:unnamed protein product [Chilo suppressalis]